MCWSLGSFCRCTSTTAEYTIAGCSVYRSECSTEGSVLQSLRPGERLDCFCHVLTTSSGALLPYTR